MTPNAVHDSVANLLPPVLSVPVLEEAEVENLADDGAWLSLTFEYLEEEEDDNRQHLEINVVAYSRKDNPERARAIAQQLLGVLGNRRLEGLRVLPGRFAPLETENSNFFGQRTVFPASFRRAA